MPKHIAIVGYGSAALAILKALQDLPPELRRGWRVSVFERREGLGGQWLPDDTVQDPATSVPLTGLYPNLRTNTPINMMTYNYSMDLFPPGVDLFPHWTVILEYLEKYAQTWGLYNSEPADWERAERAGRAGKVEQEVESSHDRRHQHVNGANSHASHNGHANGNGSQKDAPPLAPVCTPADEARRELPRRILTNRELYSATWVSSPSCSEGCSSTRTGKWRVVSRFFRPTAHGDSRAEEFVDDDVDAIIDATGHLVHPTIPHWTGEQDWLTASPPHARFKRRIMHSAYYRGPEQFTDQVVLIIGAGPSGQDGALQISKTAKKVYHSVTPTLVLSPTWQFERKDRIAHVTKDEIVFSNGEILRDVDTIYLGTGFHLRYEYLERGGILQRRPNQLLRPVENETWPGIVSTDYYLRPTFMHTVSFAENHGPASLFWVGQLMSTSYRLSNGFQAALAAWTIALPEILPPREEMQRLLAADEARLVALGRSVERIGHRQGAPHLGESETYQRSVAAFLGSRGIQAGNADAKTGVVLEDWRWQVRKEFWRIQRGWSRLEKLGRAKGLVEGLRTEQDYADLCALVVREQTAVEVDRDPNETEVGGWQ